MSEHQQWEQSYLFLKRLVDKLGPDAPLSLALGMCQLFEPLDDDDSDGGDDE